MSSDKISIVIPVYRSESSLPILVSRLITVSKEMRRDFEIVLVDDHSPDNSWEVLKKLKNGYGKSLKIVRLLTNHGQHNAILCGFNLSTGQIVVTMDDDLQNPPEEIPKLVNAIESGYDLAIGDYDSKKHSYARNSSGRLVDWIQRKIFNLPKGFQLTSFRAATRAVIESVCRMGGVFPYITAMLFSNASRYTNVKVRHDVRQFGKSNYTIKRGLRLAANLILSYSSYPLYFVSLLCAMSFLFSAGYGFFVLLKILIYGSSVPGWASIMIALSFFNALTLLSCLIIILYISRINQQITRTRVSYSIAELHE